MKEAYCSFETAKLLKEKGFDWDCTSHFDSNHIECPNTPMNFNSTKYWLSRPTHQMACAWLREEHNIFITIYCERDGFCDEPYFRATWQRLDDEQIEYPIGNCDYTYYEICVDNAIRYALENLMEKKPQVDGFDAELNALLKKYEHLSKEELQETLEFYLDVIKDDLDVVRKNPNHHEGWVNIFKQGDNFASTSGKIYSSAEQAHEHGKEYHDYVATIKIKWRNNNDTNGTN